MALHGDVLVEAVALVQQATGAGGTEEEWLAWETAAPMRGCIRWHLRL